MSLFLRLLTAEDKAGALLDICSKHRVDEKDSRIFESAPEAFDVVPGKPFVYWVSDAIREMFQQLPPFENEGRVVKQGLATADDFRFVRSWWEIFNPTKEKHWFPITKGGAYSPFYADIYLTVNWNKAGTEISSFSGSVIRNPDFYFRPGLTSSPYTHLVG